MSSHPPLTRHPGLTGKTFLVCLGAAKCGTSWLHNYLGNMPACAVSPLKELHFFNAHAHDTAMGDMEALALSRLALHLDHTGTRPDALRDNAAFQASIDRAAMIYDDNAYFAHFARLCSAETRCFADITPGYSVLRGADLARIKTFAISQGCRLRLLFIMRDPVDRFWSQIRHLEQMKPADEATRNWQHALTARPLTARADYRAVVSALDDAVDEDDRLYLFYETLFQDDSLRRLCTFCDLPFIPGVPSERLNQTRITAPIPDPARHALLNQLAPQYAFCHTRFGSAVPTTWQG